MEAYITGLSLLSPQQTFCTDDFLSSPVSFESSHLRCIEPSYKEYLDPVLARRMGRIIKMGVATATECLKDAEIKVPDAIISGTALGCLESTEKFLLSVIEDDEQFLTPTQFVQSTQNTVAAQIALQLQCTNYNFTYVHRAFSFETALLDALMTLDEGTAKDILVGGHDEMTANNYAIYKRLDTWKEEISSGKDLLKSESQGSLAGEGSAFFVLSKEKNKKSYAKLKAIKTLYKPKNTSELKAETLIFLKQNSLQAEDVQLVIYGSNGNSRHSAPYEALKMELFSNADAAYFKHLCGEYQTAGGFALWLASRILHRQEVPEAVSLEKIKNKDIKHVLIYNHYMNENHAFYLLERV